MSIIISKGSHMHACRLINGLRLLWDPDASKEVSGADLGIFVGGFHWF